MPSLLQREIGPYRLVDFLGAGGMGEVYRAVHARIDRVVAIKVLTDADPRLAERFINEARIQAGLHHPNIATLYEFEELAGKPCIVMEYVDGQTLSERIRTQGALPPAEAACVFRQVVEAIAYVHEHGIVHRDIKAANIRIGTHGEVKLLDFGIARDAGSKALTRLDSVVGTQQYLAPEQLDGARGDQRSDIWALGVLLYEMSTGHLPFESDTLTGLVEQIHTARYPPPERLNPAVPEVVRAIIRRCLQRKPEQRYISARELLHDSLRLAAAAAAPRAPPGEPRRQAIRVPWPLWGGVLVLLVLLIGSVLMLQPDEAEPPPPALLPRAVEPPPPAVGTPPQPLATVSIDTYTGRAEVYQDGRPVGTTPWRLQAPVGARIEAVLKRQGYKDVPISFHVSEHGNEYFFPMEKRP